MSFRTAFLTVVVLALTFVASVDAGHVCQKPDCSDVVGAAMVKDNLGTSAHFHELNTHEEAKEAARIQRIELLQRSHPSI